MGSPYESADPYNEGEGEVNPLAYLTNLADCMLILACGFIVALVMAWNVDLPNVNKVEQSDEAMVEIDDVEALEEQLQSGGDSYTERGKVYEDPETGMLYMVEENADGSSDSTSDNSDSDQSEDNTASEEAPASTE